MAPFNEKGLLNPGFSEYKLNEIEKIFVEEFKESQTRKEIYSGFLKWMKELLNICIPNEVWLDGSFVTSKINPNDIDLVCFIEVMEYSRKFMQINQLRTIGLQNKCDTYIAFSPSLTLSQELNNKFKYQISYWKGQFGFDREDNPKGMVKITKESLILFLKEGIKDVK